MSALDTLADRAQAASKRLAGQGGIRSKLAEQLAEDAEFLRKLKPTLIAQRAKGDAPTDQSPNGRPTAPVAVDVKEPKKNGGVNPFVVAGVAFVAGVALAKWIDWRGHAHPRW
jgi:hypothetical protein